MEPPESDWYILPLVIGFTLMFVTWTGISMYGPDKFTNLVASFF